jgi:hypothetical protein
LSAAALKPDLARLAEASAPSNSRRKATAATKAAPAAAQKPSFELDAVKAKIEDLQRRLERAEGRASTAEERASAAEARAKENERTASERLARMRAALGD